MSISEALSTSFNEELLESQAQSGPTHKSDPTHHKSDPTHQRGASTHHKSASVTSCVPALISPPRHDTDDPRPLTSDLGHLDLDPMAFQASGAPLPGPTYPEGRKHPEGNRDRCRGNEAEGDAKKNVSPADKMAATTSALSPEDGTVQPRQEEKKGEEEKASLTSAPPTNNAAPVPEEAQMASADSRIRTEPVPASAAPVAVPDSVSSTPLTSSPSMRSEAPPSEAAPNRAGSKRSGSCSADCKAAAMESKQNRPDPGENRTV